MVPEVMRKEKGEKEFAMPAISQGTMPVIAPRKEKGKAKENMVIAKDIAKEVERMERSGSTVSTTVMDLMARTTTTTTPMTQRTIKV